VRREGGGRGKEVWEGRKGRVKRGRGKEVRGGGRRKRKEGVRAEK
jgi:hypothetical protein